MSGTTRRTVVFRASASSRVGGGHVVRCLALAFEMRKQGWRIVFASGEETAATVPALEAAVDALIVVPEARPEDEPGVMRSALPEGCSVLVVDHYGRDEAFESACRLWAEGIVVIDDLPVRRHDGDLLVDASGGRTAMAWEGRLPPGCRVLTGPRFALIRPGFGAPDPGAVAGRSRARIRRLFVSMGATDAGDLTSGMLAVAGDLGLPAEGHVLLSGSAPHLARVRECVASLPGWHLHVDPPDVAALMAPADVAIGTAGINGWERCALSIPSLIVIAAENQRGNALAVEAAGGGVVVGEGDALDPMALARELLRLDGDAALRKRMGEAAHSCCDGRGAGRVAAAVASLTK